MLKRLIALFLVLIMICSMVGCGRLDENGVYYIVDVWSDNEKELKKALKDFQRTLDPQQIYASITYNEKLLYGTYQLENWEKSKKDFAKNAKFAELEYCSTYTTTFEPELFKKNLSVMPVGIDVGSPCLYEVRGNQDHEWASLTFATETGGTVDVLCTYSVDGHNITFTPLDKYVSLHDEDYKRIGFEYTLGQDSLTYTFAFSGVTLTLSKDDQSVTLLAEDFSDNGHSSISIGGYLSAGATAVDGIDSISISLSKDYAAVYLDLEDESLYTKDRAVALTEDGWMVMMWTVVDAEGNETKHVKEFAYFLGDGSTLTLSDGTNFYYYTDNYFTREMGVLSGMVSEEDKALLENMEEEELKDLAEKKTNLLTDLAEAYQQAGLNVHVNTQTGEIALDATVLFGVNESNISNEGKTFLQKFIKVYTSIVFSDKYENFVSKIMVEGHTDTDGTYERNQILSKERADSVKDYCLSAECGVEANYLATLQNMLETVGYAYDKPIYDADGNVDMAASRRVSFRFLVNLGK